MLGISRRSAVPGILWHEVNTVQEYYDLAQSWGLTSYAPADFQMPTVTEAAQTEAAIMRERNPNFEPPDVTPGKGETFFVKP